MAKQTTTNPQRPPQELDLNLESLRKEANNNLVASLREALKRFDEIDALENMLQRQMGTVAAIAAQEAHTNGNGHRRVGRPSNVTEEEPRKKRSYKSAGVHATVAEMRAREDATLEILQKVGTGGITTSEFMEELRERKMFPKNHIHLRNSARKLLLPLIAKRQVLAIKGRGRHADMKYFLVQPKPATPGKPTTPVKPTTPAKSAAKIKGGHPVGDGLSMRELVTAALVKAPNNTATPGEITNMLLKDGVPARRGNNPLNNHVNWALKALADQGRASKRLVKGKPVYAIKRPAVSVTKSEPSAKSE